MKEAETAQSLFKMVESQELTAKDFGFYWETIDQILEQIRSECDEVHDSWQRNDRSHLQEEVGDLIQAAVSLAVFCGLDPDETLHKSIQKFQKRYDAVVKLAKQDGHTDLHGQSMDFFFSIGTRQSKNKTTGMATNILPKMD